jgi:hypothetical protein
LVNKPLPNVHMRLTNAPTYSSIINQAASSNVKSSPLAPPATAVPQPQPPPPLLLPLPTLGKPAADYHLNLNIW